MKINELNEVITKALKESFDLEEIAKQEFKECIETQWLDLMELREVENHLTEIVSELAEREDWKLYDDHIVLDVKGRPKIANDDVIEFLGDDEETFNFAIQQFADRMDKKYSDFVIDGRSGGFWGFDNYSINVSEQGYKEAESAFVIYLKEHLNEFDEYDTSDENSMKELCQDLLTNYVGNATERIGEVLAEDANNFKFSDEFVSKMKALESDIEDEEEMMNGLDYWEN